MSGTNTKQQAEVEVPIEEPVPTSTSTPSRDEIRASIFGAKPDTKLIDFFGNKIELRQPVLGTTMEMRRATPEDATVQMLVQYAFIPVYDAEGKVQPLAGTEHVFEETDADSIKQIPFGPDMQRLTTSVNELIGVTPQMLEAMVKDATKSAGEGSAENSGDVNSVGAP
jgi:hypothetical protein